MEMTFNFEKSRALDRDLYTFYCFLLTLTLTTRPKGQSLFVIFVLNNLVHGIGPKSLWNIHV